MKKLLLFLIAFSPLFSLAQCPTGSVSLTSQAEVDDFVANFPDCTQIDGNLTIGTYPQLIGAEAALDLTGLSGLTNITGTLNIYGTSTSDGNGGTLVGSLEGLENVSSVRSLLVGVPPGIFGGFPAPYESLEPLGGIEGQLDSLFLTRVVLNEPLPPFSNVEGIGYCRFEYMRGVESTPTFPSLTYLGDLTVVGSNVEDDTLSTVVIPEQLTEIAPAPETFNFPFGGIFIQINAGVTEIIGGENLTFLSQGVFTNNRELTDMSAFDNVTEIGESGLAIQSCQAEIFNSFKKLETSGIPSIGGVGLSFASVDECGEQFFDSVDFRISEEVDDGNQTSYELNIRADQVGSINVTGNFTNLFGLDLRSTLASEITGFASLDSITQERLIINTPGVSQLPYFENLVHVEGDVELLINSGDWALEDLSGLGALTTVGGDLNIGSGGSSGGESFLSLDGLENLNQVGGRLRVRRLVALTDISALSNLVSAGTFNLDRLESLSIAADLENLASVEEINVSETNLTVMPNFPLITSLAGDLDVEDNLVMESLGGLESLESIGGSINVNNNPALVSIALPDDISFSGELTIQDNSALQNCGSSPSICNLLSQATSAVISNNGNLCDGAEAVLAQCALSADDLEQYVELTVFFNADALMIQSNQYLENGRLDLFSIEGKRVYTQSATLQSGENRFQVPDLSSGVYILSFENGENSHRSKVFVSQR